MSWEKSSTYFGLDVNAIQDGLPASAHVIRTLTRSANYLGGCRKNLLTFAVDHYSGELAQDLSIPLSDIGRRRITTIPLLKPRGLVRADLIFIATWNWPVDITFLATTSRGTFSRTEEGVSGQLTITIPLELNPSRAEVVDLSYQAAGSYYSAHGSAGTPLSGVHGDLRVYLPEQRVIQYIGASTPAWSVSGNTFVLPDKHWLVFHDGITELEEHEITLVHAADTLFIQDPIEVETANPTEDYSLPLNQADWSIQRRERLLVQSLGFITEEINP